MSLRSRNGAAPTKSHRPPSPLTLPRMLSPTLPDWVEEVVPKMPKRMLSPTLPSWIDERAQRVTNGMSKGKNSVGNGGPGSTTSTTSSTSMNINTGTTNAKTDKAKRIAPTSLVIKLKISPKRLRQVKRRSLAPAANVVGLGIGDASDNRASLPNRPPVSGTSKRSRHNRNYSSSEDEDNKDGPGDRPEERRNLTPKTATPKSASKGTPTMANITRSPRVATSQSSASASVSSEQRERNSRLLRSKMSHWVGIAQDRKHDADSAYRDGQGALAAVCATDALLSFIIGFDYEDKGDQVIKHTPHPNSWSSLVPYASQVIAMYEKLHAPLMAGACYQIRALVHLRICENLQSSLQRVMTSYAASTSSSSSSSKKYTEDSANTPIDAMSPVTVFSDDSLAEEAMALTRRYFGSRDAAVQDFRRGFQGLEPELVQQHFPKTWARRSTSPQPAAAREGGYRPAEDPFYLPLHMFSSLQEASALGYNLAAEWAQAEGVTTTWALARR